MPPFQIDAAAGLSGNEIRFVPIFSAVLRWRFPIIFATIAGMVAGGSYAVVRPKYESTAVFIPQSGDALASSALALAASQLGIRSAGASGNWTSAIYADLVISRPFLERIAIDTVVVQEMGNRPIAVMDLLDVAALPIARRRHRAVKELSKLIDAIEDKKLGVVRVTTATRWPSFSAAVTERLIRDVNRFNLSTRQSQASAERKHIEAQVLLASDNLRNAENHLRDFLERNRQITEAPSLTFERDRLQRQVTLRQTLYTTLMQQLEDARIREVRETPVITILQPPSFPVAGENRGVLRWSLVGGFTCAVLAVAFLTLRHFWLASVWRDESEESRAFVAEIKRAVPGLRSRD